MHQCELRERLRIYAKFCVGCSPSQCAAEVRFISCATLVIAVLCSWTVSAWLTSIYVTVSRHEHRRPDTADSIITVATRRDVAYASVAVTGWLAASLQVDWITHLRAPAACWHTWLA